MNKILIIFLVILIVFTVMNCSFSFNVNIDSGKEKFDRDKAREEIKSKLYIKNNGYLKNSRLYDRKLSKRDKDKINYHINENNICDNHTWIHFNQIDVMISNINDSPFDTDIVLYSNWGEKFNKEVFLKELEIFLDILEKPEKFFDYYKSEYKKVF